MKKLASRPVPPWPTRVVWAVLLTATFVTMRTVLGTVLTHQVGFSLLLPAVLLAGLAGGMACAVLTIFLCIASLWIITQYLGSPPLPAEVFVSPAVSFIFISLICAFVGATLRQAMHRLYVTQNRMASLIDTQRHTAQQLRAMLDQVSAGIIRTDLDGKIIETNEQLARMLDRPAGSLAGLNILDLTHPDDAEETRKHLLLHKQNAQTDWQVEKRYLRTDGQAVHVLLDVRTLMDDAGKPYGLIGIAIDITNARKAEEALNESRHNFLNVVDALPVMLWLTDRYMTGRFVNRAYLDFVNKDSDEVRFSDLQAMLHPDDFTHTVEQFQMGLESGKGFELLARYRRHDGQWRWLRSMHQPRLDRDGSPRGMISTAYDVTDTQEAAARVQESEARFRTIADSAPAIIWMVDNHGNTEFGNRRFRSLFAGKPPERLLSTVREMIVDEDLPVFDRTLAEATHEEKRFSHLGRIQHPIHGVSWLRTEAAPRYDLHGNLLGFTGVSIDVTETQRAEHDLKRINELLEERVSAALAEKAVAEAELVRAHRLEAVGRLTGGVAHDFNNLLTVIMGGLEIIRKSEDPDRRQKMTEAALAAAQRGERLTGQLLAFSRRQTLRPSSIDINAIIREGEPLLAKAVGENMVLEFKLKRGKAPSHVDSAKFEAALINLLVNARDASDDDARICVETADYIMPDEGQPPSLTSSAGIHPADLLPGRYIRVTVADNGSGMTEEVQKQVFEPFFTTKGIGRGTGLGLSQVYGFTRQSGGSISIQSAPGEGTRINLFLPWQPLSASTGDADGSGEFDDNTADRNAAYSNAPMLALRLLLVEDDPDVANVAAAFLNTEGVEVDLVPNAVEALARLRERPYDVLLSDVLMPGGMSGIELAHRTSAEWPHMRIILSSGFPGEAEALRNTPWAFLAKPYSPSQLRSVLSDSLKAKQPAQ